MKIDLSGFCGTTAYHKINPFTKIVVTDGIMHLVNNGCHWLFSDMSIEGNKSVGIGFVVWRFEITENEKGKITAWTDTPYESDLLFERKIEFTDFEKKTGLKEIEWYQEGNVFLLKSEH